MRWKNIINNPLVDGAQFAPIHKNAVALGGAAGAFAGMMSAVANEMYRQAGFEDVQGEGLWHTADTNRWNYQTFQEQKQFAREQYERELLENRVDALKERQWALEDRDYENKYNSPAEQIRRYREAGLNPFLMMDNSAPVASVSVNNPSTSAPRGSTPSAPTFTPLPVVPDTQYQMFGSIASSLGSLLSDSMFRKQQNDLEWFKAVSDSDLDPDTKNWILKNKMFKGDRNTDMAWKMKQQAYQAAVYDATMKEVTTLFQQEMNEEQRKQFARNEKMFPKLMDELEAKIRNLNSQSDLFDKDGQIKDEALKMLKSQVDELARYEGSVPDWAKTLISVLDRVFGGPLGRVLQLLK